MAGTIIADKIQTENSFLTLNVGSTQIASMNASGIYSNTGTLMIRANGSVSNTAITGVITASQLATSLNLATNNVQVASIQTATGTPAITFAANGQMTLANASLQLTGGQIQFPATQIPSGDANCLDDYEEGTWSPSVGGNATYTNQYGTYVKIGKMVTVNFDMAISSIGTGSTNVLSGLPFTSSANGFPRTGCISYYSDLSVSPIFIAFYVENNATTTQWVWNTTTSATVGNNGGNLFKNSARVIGSVTYMATA